MAPKLLTSCAACLNRTPHRTLWDRTCGKGMFELGFARQDYVVQNLVTVTRDRTLRQVLETGSCREGLCESGLWYRVVWDSSV